MADHPDEELWWDADDYEAHDPLFRHITSEHDGFVKDNLGAIWDQYRLYDLREARCLQNNAGSDRASSRPRLALNVVRSVVNAVHSKIIQSKPRPTFLTIGQGQQARSKAKKTQAYVDGSMYHADVHDVAADVLLNALILGSAVGHIYRDSDGKPAVENVFLGEMRRDAGAYRDRHPRNEYRVRAVDRQGLIDEMCHGPDESQNKRIKELIDGSGRSSRELRVYGDDECDQVTVIDAYRRPSSSDADDGRHVLCVEGGCILDEGWNTKPPFVWVHWNRSPNAFTGTGVAATLESLQTMINWVLVNIQEQQVYGGPKVLIDRAAAVNPDDLSSEIYGLIEYNGPTPPTVVHFPRIGPEDLQMLEFLYNKAFDEVGVSQLAARSEKPAGLNSGKALLTFSDLESAKFVAFGQAYERWVRDVAESFLWLAINDDDLDDEQKKRPVYAPTKQYRQRYLEVVTKADIVGSLDEAKCQVFPTSALAQTPSAKLQQVGEMADKGLIPPEVAVQLLDFPDLENQGALMASPAEYIDMVVDTMLEDGEPLSPEPWVFSQLAQLRMMQHIQLAQIRKYPSERIDLLAIYLNQLRENEAAWNAQQQTAQAPPPGAAPMAAAPPAGMPPAA